MAGVFDPYQAWLGIPPHEQPPHRYRLLGLPPWESDPARIEQAAAAWLAFLRTRQNGEQAETANRLIGEITEALACLLNPASKAAYDQQLHAQRQALAPGEDAGGETLALEITGPFVEPPFPTPPPGSVPSGSAAGQILREAMAAGSVDQLGEYQLLEKLGRGGMGTVYKALHTKLGRVVALKVLSKDRTWDERAVARFEREMKAVGALDHPHIVRAMDAREIGETRFLVMEYVDGLDLAEVVRRCHPMAVADACELVRQAALALDGAHRHGLIHRDVKPSNLMLNRQGQVKLLDLGLARFEMSEPGGDEVTGEGQAIGTVEYMAPEQLSDSSSVDIRADLYSLGCTFYKFLAGQTPFGGSDYKGTLERLMAHVHKPVPSIWPLRGDVPPELVHLLERMLAKDAAQRYATPAKVAELLAPLAQGHDLLALLARAEGRATAPAVPVPPPAVSTEEASSTLTRFIHKVHEEPHRPAAEAEEGSSWATRVIYLASAAIVLLVVAIGAVLGHRALKTATADPVLIFSWPEDQRAEVRLWIDERPVAFPPDGPLEHRCPPGRHKLRATRPDHKPWQKVVTLEAGQRKEIVADWLPETHLIFHWPLAERRGARLEINRRPVDLGPLAGERTEFKLPIATGLHKIRITRPGHAPLEESVRIIEGEDRILRPILDRLSTEAPAAKGRPAAKTIRAKVAKIDATPAGETAPSNRPDPPAPALDAALTAYREQDARYREAVAASEKRAAAWDFHGAGEELAKVRLEGPEQQARLAVRRDELARLAALKDQMIAVVNRADPPIKKGDLLLRGANGELTKADQRGIEARLPNEKTELHPWAELGEKARNRMFQLTVDRQKADDWVAAALLALVCRDGVLAEKCFEQARALGAEVHVHQAALAAEAFAAATEQLAQGQFQEAAARLDELEKTYAALPWLAQQRKMVAAARERVEAGLQEAEAEKLYAEAASFFRDGELFDLRPIVEQLATRYASTRVVTGGGRTPSLAELREAIAPLGKVLTVHSQKGQGDFATIQAAIEAAPARSLIEILDRGPFNEKLHVPLDKTGLTIRGRRGCWPVITSLGPLKDFPVLVAVDGPSTTLRRLILVHATPVGQAPHCLAVSGSDVRLRAVVVAMEVGEQALWTDVGSEARFDECLILANGFTQGRHVFQNCLLLGKSLRIGLPGELRSCTVLNTLTLGTPPSVLVDSIVDQLRNDALHRIDHCNIFGMAPPADSRASFSAPPQFRAPEELDYQLAPGSPCLKKASDGGDLGCRFTPEMLDLCKQAAALRAKGIIKF